MSSNENDARESQNAMFAVSNKPKKTRNSMSGATDSTPVPNTNSEPNSDATASGPEAQEPSAEQSAIVLSSNPELNLQATVDASAPVPPTAHSIPEVYSGVVVPVEVRPFSSHIAYVINGKHMETATTTERSGLTTAQNELQAATAARDTALAALNAASGPWKQALREEKQDEIERLDAELKPLREAYAAADKALDNITQKVEQATVALATAEQNEKVRQLQAAQAKVDASKEEGEHLEKVTHRVTEIPAVLEDPTDDEVDEEEAKPDDKEEEEKNNKDSSNSLMQSLRAAKNRLADGARNMLGSSSSKPSVTGSGPSKGTAFTLSPEEQDLESSISYVDKNDLSIDELMKNFHSAMKEHKKEHPEFKEYELTLNKKDKGVRSFTVSDQGKERAVVEKNPDKSIVYRFSEDGLDADMASIVLKASSQKKLKLCTTSTKDAETILAAAAKNGNITIELDADTRAFLMKNTKELGPFTKEKLTGTMSADASKKDETAQEILKQAKTKVAETTAAAEAAEKMLAQTDAALKKAPKLVTAQNAKTAAESVKKTADEKKAAAEQALQEAEKRAMEAKTKAAEAKKLTDTAKSPTASPPSHSPKPK